MEAKQTAHHKLFPQIAAQAVCLVVGLAGFSLHWHVSGKVARSEIDNSNYSIDTMMLVTGVYALVTLGAIVMTIRFAVIRSKAIVIMGWGLVALLFGLMTISIFSDLVSYVAVV